MTLSSRVRLRLVPSSQIACEPLDTKICRGITFLNFRGEPAGPDYSEEVSGMGAGVNISALLVGLSAFAGWTFLRFSVSQHQRWVTLLGGVGILALSFSVVCPDDDNFQQELIRPATPSVRVSAHSRVAPARSPSGLAIKAPVGAGYPTRTTGPGRSPAKDHPLEFDTHFHPLISIHSPPLTA